MCGFVFMCRFIKAYILVKESINLGIDNEKSMMLQGIFIIK